MRLPLLICITLIAYFVRSFKIFTEEHQLKVLDYKFLQIFIRNFKNIPGVTPFRHVRSWKV